MLFALTAFGAGINVRPALAGTVPYFHDFLGGVCVREQDLESAFLAGGKGLRAPPICIETPCDEVLDRQTYEREILGRTATEEEWDDYLSMQNVVCSIAEPPDALTMLLPFDTDTGEPIAASDPIFAPNVYAPFIPWSPDGPSIIDLRTPITRSYTPPSSGGFPTLSFGGGGSSDGSGTSGGGGGGGNSLQLSSSPTPVPVAPSIVGALTALAALRILGRRRAT